MQRDSSTLESLLENPRVWRGHAHARVQAGLSTGYEKLDRHLPGGGWPRHTLTEILVEHHGIGELEILMPALARLSAENPATPHIEPGWVAWVAPPFVPYPPALKQSGLNLSRLLIVRPRNATETLWAAEQALVSGTCSAVLLWPERLDDQAGRRLSLAAEKGRSWAIAFRPLSARRQPSAAALRLAIQAGRDGADIDILKSRGGRPVSLRGLFPGTPE